MACNIQVGQTLYWQRERLSRDPARGTWAPTEVTVAKVGRKMLHVSAKWITATADLHTLQITSAVAGDRLYRSREEWEIEIAARLAWHRLHDHLRYNDCPPGLTAETIRQAAALLGVEVP
jgi:hypothetical protein